MSVGSEVTPSLRRLTVRKPVGSPLFCESVIAPLSYANGVYLGRGKPAFCSS
jgi:hypothetical protein